MACWLTLLEPFSVKPKLDRSERKDQKAKKKKKRGSANIFERVLLVAWPNPMAGPAYGLLWYNGSRGPHVPIQETHEKVRGHFEIPQQTAAEKEGSIFWCVYGDWMPYLSILCSLLGVMPQPLSVNVRQSWPSSSTTSIHICLAHTPGSDALSGMKANRVQWQTDRCTQLSTFLRTESQTF